MCIRDTIGYYFRSLRTVALVHRMPGFDSPSMDYISVSCHEQALQLTQVRIQAGAHLAAINVAVSDFFKIWIFLADGYDCRCQNSIVFIMSFFYIFRLSLRSLRYKHIQNTTQQTFRIISQWHCFPRKYRAPPLTLGPPPLLSPCKCDTHVAPKSASVSSNLFTINHKIIL